MLCLGLNLTNVVLKVFGLTVLITTAKYVQYSDHCFSYLSEQLINIFKLKNISYCYICIEKNNNKLS